jgi:hypothetical protein
MPGARALSFLVAGATLTLAGAGPAPTAGRLPISELAVRSHNEWMTFWRSTENRTSWAPDIQVLTSIQWQPGASGLMWAELPLQGNGEARRTRVVLVRLDPRRVRLELANGTTPGGFEGAWTILSAKDSAVAAINAGQFAGGAVWGWVKHDGVEYRPPGKGPLAIGVIIDSSGMIRFTRDYAAPGVREGFQSYPLLLEHGEVPELLRAPNPYMDHGHRDARLAIGLLPDSSLMIALTRYDGLGGALGGIPFGLTVPEMAALMGALGCRDAVALDGGISAQLLVREFSGRARTWPGLRRVPLALLAVPR